MPGLVAIMLAVGTGVAIGAFQGSFVALIGVPSFVVTLAGLIAFQGVIIKALPQGVIVLQDNYVNDIANYHFSDLAGWIIAAVITGSYFAARASYVIGRRRGLAAPSWWWRSDHGRRSCVRRRRDRQPRAGPPVRRAARRGSLHRDELSRHQDDVRSPRLRRRWERRSRTARRNQRRPHPHHRLRHLERDGRARRRLFAAG